MHKLVRRSFIAGVSTVVLVGAAAGPAAAHFCFKTQVNDHAASGMAGSSNWVAFSDIAAQEFPEMCAEGVEYVANAAGATSDTLINSHGTMAGGTLRKGPDAGNKAISHLDFQALFGAIEDGMALC